MNKILYKGENILFNYEHTSAIISFLLLQLCRKFYVVARYARGPIIPCGPPKPCGPI